MNEPWRIFLAEGFILPHHFDKSMTQALLFGILDIDFLKIAVGIFIVMICFGLLQKAKILGKSKIINFFIAAIIAFFLIRNDNLVSFILNFSSNIAVLLLAGLVFVMVMSLSGISGAWLMKIFLSVLLILPFLDVYPFYLLRIYLPPSAFKVLAVIDAVIIILIWILWKRK